MPTCMLLVYINSLKPVGEMQHNKTAYKKQLVKEVQKTSPLFLTHFPTHSPLIRKWYPQIIGKEARESFTKPRVLDLCISKLSVSEASMQAAASSHWLHPPTDVIISAKTERKHRDDLLQVGSRMTSRGEETKHSSGSINAHQWQPPSLCLPKPIKKIV